MLQLLPLLIEHINVNELPTYFKNRQYGNIAIGDFNENMKKLLQAIRRLNSK